MANKAITLSKLFCFCREIYYWDSYFTLLGLQNSNRIELIQNMVNNFSHLIDQFGYRWAAKELYDNGLKTLLLERGKDVVHIQDYPTTTKNPWNFPHLGELPLSIAKENPIVSRCYAFSETTQHFFVKDKDYPYIQENHLIGFAVTRLGGLPELPAENLI
ncbi:MAG: trehalase family glycosidase [Ginsengibacter sp.]